MIMKESYSFNTFTGLRVGEIQKKTDIMRWLHIPSDENIADLLTKGATPYKLGPGTPWQLGPAWLVHDKDYWPVTVRPSDQSSLLFPNPPPNTMLCIWLDQNKSARSGQKR